MIKAAFEIQGRLTSDVIVQQGNNGDYARFCVAVDDSYMSQGQQVKRTDFIHVVCFKSSLMNYLRIFKKGGYVSLRGKISPKERDDGQGGKIYSTNLEVTEANYIGMIMNAQQALQQQQQQHNQQQKPNTGYQKPQPQSNGYQNQQPQNNGYQNQQPQNNGYQNQQPQYNGYQNQQPQNNGYQQQHNQNSPMNMQSGGFEQDHNFEDSFYPDNM